jgi:4-hydroxy-2-oxoheptanedioate aldolase
MTALTNQLKSKLANGEAVIGTMVTMPSPNVMQLMSAAGFDWLIIDREHGAIGDEQMQAMINATKGTDTVPLVRVPEDENWMVKTALDAGALGIYFPLIKTAEQAEEAIASTLYPPAGKRGFGPFYAPSRWNMSMADYAASVDDAILRVLMIEHIEAVQNIETILAVPHIDVAFIAPFDLSQSLGVAGDFEHPKFLEAVTTIKTAVENAPVALGGLAPSPEKGREMLETGYKMLMMAFDSKIIEDAATHVLRIVRS